MTSSATWADKGKGVLVDWVEDDENGGTMCRIFSEG
jgi:hypothetical protein